MDIVTYIYPLRNSIIFNLCDNTMYLSLFFAGCGLLAESERSESLSDCLKTNLRLSSGFLIMSSLLNMYRINII